MSYLLDKSLKSHCVLGLIPSCHLLGPDSLLPPSSLPAPSCCQTVHTWPSNTALGLTQIFSGLSSLCNLFPFFSFSLLPLTPHPPLFLHSFTLSQMSARWRAWRTTGVGICCTGPATPPQPSPATPWIRAAGAPSTGTPWSPCREMITPEPLSSTSVRG